MVTIVSELGTCFQPGKPETLGDAAKAALNCGADLVKVQCFEAEGLCRRRGGLAFRDDLARWELSFTSLERIFGDDLGKVGVTFFNSYPTWRIQPQLVKKLAFLKTATQEYQYAKLAQRLSKLASEAGIPMIVSVPRDGCLVVGNYSSVKPITWLYSEPVYPAKFSDYQCGQGGRWDRIEGMKRVLPGRFGLSDHTTDQHMAKFTLHQHPDLDMIEKHFCYDENLRGKTPDSGSWALGCKEFEAFVKEIKR